MCLGIPGEVMAVEDREGLPFGRVRFGGIVRDVCLAYEPDAAVGEYVLVHVGFAISRLDAEEAARTWEMLEALGQADEVADGIDEDPGAGPADPLRGGPA